MKILRKFTNGYSEINRLSSRKWSSGGFLAIYKLFNSKKKSCQLFQTTKSTFNMEWFSLDHVKEGFILSGPHKMKNSFCLQTG